MAINLAQFVVASFPWIKALLQIITIVALKLLCTNFSLVPRPHVEKEGVAWGQVKAAQILHATSS